jgi:hypothetical protein
VSGSDLIEHPCPICLEPSRTCGCTREDLHAFHARCRELRGQAKRERKRGGHRVAKQGPKVFHETETDPSQHVIIPVGGKLLKARSTMPAHPIRTSLMDEYGGGSDRAEGAGR